MGVKVAVKVKGNVIVRQMPSLEAVGGVTNICSDKTGTLTQGRMIARKIWLRGDLTGITQDTTDPYDPGSGTVKVSRWPVYDFGKGYKNGQYWSIFSLMIAYR